MSSVEAYLDDTYSAGRLSASRVPVVCTCPDLQRQAEALARRLGSCFLPSSGDFEDETTLWLELAPDGLALTDGSMTIKGDFADSLERLKPHLLGKELLVKAARLKGFKGEPCLIDATAGLGADSLLLAAAGFKVTMFESNPVIAALLEDTLRRAGDCVGLSSFAERLDLICADSVRGMCSLNFEPDVVLLDPMFPARKKSAQVKKKFQLLHCLESPCSNEEELFKAAVKANPKKIVVKRPPKGPVLAGKKPSHQIKGKAVRYDCYVFAR